MQILQKNEKEPCTICSVASACPTLQRYQKRIPKFIGALHYVAFLVGRFLVFIVIVFLPPTRNFACALYPTGTNLDITKRCVVVQDLCKRPAMCRSTDAVSPSMVRKRSSCTESSCSSDDDTTVTNRSMPKRVSFDAQVRIYPLERLSNEHLCDVFYRPADYRRFRSDSCLEILDQGQPQEHLSPLTILFERLVTALQANRGHNGQRRMLGQANKAISDYPWMESYYPQEECDAALLLPPPVVAAFPRTEADNVLSDDGHRERRTIQELAFIS